MKQPVQWIGCYFCAYLPQWIFNRAFDPSILVYALWRNLKCFFRGFEVNFCRNIMLLCTFPLTNSVVGHDYNKIM